MVEAKVVRIAHAGYDACDPRSAPQDAGGDPLGAREALEEAAVDGGCTECGRGTEKKRESDDRAGVGLVG